MFAAIADIFSYGFLMNIHFHLSIILYNFIFKKNVDKILFIYRMIRVRYSSSVGLQRPVIVWMEYHYLGMENINFNNKIIQIIDQ